MEDKDKLGGYLIQGEDGELLIVCINEDHDEASVKQELPEPSMSTSENETENQVQKVIPNVASLRNLLESSLDSVFAQANSTGTLPGTVTLPDSGATPGPSQQSLSIIKGTATCEASTSGANIEDKIDDYIDSLFDDEDDDDEDEGAIGGDTPLAMVIQYLNQHCTGYPEIDNEVLAHMTEVDAVECVKDIDFQLNLIDKACAKFEKIVARENCIMTDINKESGVAINQQTKKKPKSPRRRQPDRASMYDIDSEVLYDSILSLNKKSRQKGNKDKSLSKVKRRPASHCRGLPYCCKCGKDSFLHTDKVFIQCFAEAKTDIMDTRLLSEVYGHFEEDRHDTVELLVYILQKFCNESQTVCCCFCGLKLDTIHSIFNHVITTESHKHFTSYTLGSSVLLAPEKQYVCVFCCTKKTACIEIISHYRYEHQIEHREQIGMFCKASLKYSHKDNIVVCAYCEMSFENLNILMQHIRKQHLIIEPMEYKKRKNPLAPNCAVPVALSVPESPFNIKRRKTSFICFYCKLRFVCAKDLKDHIEKAHSST